MKITIETDIPDDFNGMKKLIDTINSLKGFKRVTTADNNGAALTTQEELPFPREKRTRKKTTNQTAEKIINLLIKDLKSVEKIAEAANVSVKTVGEIARGKSWIRASGFEPYDNREGDEWCPSFYNRTKSGRLNRRAKELVAQFTESYKKRTKIKT